ncbi:tRNA (N6-isopentenyl adenosine(37)-C2)-methylthiotransferase MiaB [Candidatus Dojkabacteria bacterium]|nr:tRNA (N6-isopentenyl adenosine(37)-C2)-methylthiotransferase MiaB [Candidatus Dojkabacteria bacterium]
MSKFHIKTWGCQLNYADSEKIEAVLLGAGWIKSEKMEDSDLIILNTCSVRQRAEDKVAGLGRKIKKLKSKNKNLKVVMTGCMSQRIDRGCKDKTAYDPKYLKSMRRRFKWIDYFVNIGDLSSIYKIATGKKRSFSHDNAEQSYASSIAAFVPISKGCNNFCTYCIVPYTRGKEEHRSLNSIVREVRELVKNGCKLITLLGQNVNSWTGTVKGKNVGFSYLLAKIARIRGEFWLTFLTSHPKDFNDELADVMAKYDKICPYLNLPIQSASNKVLEKMNRGYTWLDYLAKIEYLSEKLPNIRLSTDVIVGFPGETEEDFEETVAFIEKIWYGMIYISEFSPRKGTGAALMKDDVPLAEKKRRKKRLESIQVKIMKKQNERIVGKEVEVLVLSSNAGKTKDLRDVEVISGSGKIGKIVKGKVKSASIGGLVVKI